MCMIHQLWPISFPVVISRCLTWLRKKIVHSMLFDDFKLHWESEYNFLNRNLEGLHQLSFLIDGYFLPSVDSYKEFFRYFNPLETDNAKAHRNLHQVSLKELYKTLKWLLTLSVWFSSGSFKGLTPFLNWCKQAQNRFVPCCSLSWAGFKANEL